MEPASAEATTPITSRTALILYGSETGNAHDLAEELCRLAERQRFVTRLCAFDETKLNDLQSSAVVLTAISTTGQGDFPENARGFWRRLRNSRLPSGCLARIKFAAFGLGDSSYTQFNWAHRKLCSRLAQLGADQPLSIGEADEQHPDGTYGCFLPWLEQLRGVLQDNYPLPAGLAPLEDDAFLLPKWELRFTNEQDGTGAPTGNRKTISAMVDRNDRLTPETHWQDVRAIQLSMPATDYQPGDVVTIYPHNAATDVDKAFEILGWKSSADRIAKCHPSDPHTATSYPFTAKISLRQLLTTHLDINSVPRRSFFIFVAHFTTDAMQKDRLLEFAKPEYLDELYDYTTRPRRSILEVLQEFDTLKIPAKYAMSVFPTIRGRKFSIASGGMCKRLKNGRTRIDLLVAIVKYRTVLKKIREGLCTRYLSALPVDSEIEIALSAGDVRHDVSTPALLIGPGTGVAPLRAMVQERAASSSRAKTLLFFGGRNRAADFFYEDEWERLRDDANLSVYTAFSRDHKHKIYVQDLIKDNPKEVYEILQNGQVFVCGSSGAMPKAVRQALLDVIVAQGKSSVEAEKMLADMTRNGTYQQETW